MRRWVVRESNLERSRQASQDQPAMWRQGSDSIDAETRFVQENTAGPGEVLLRVRSRESDRSRSVASRDGDESGRNRHATLAESQTGLSQEFDGKELRERDGVPRRPWRARRRTRRGFTRRSAWMMLTRRECMETAGTAKTRQSERELKRKELKWKLEQRNEREIEEDDRPPHQEYEKSHHSEWRKDVRTKWDALVRVKGSKRLKCTVHESGDVSWNVKESRVIQHLRIPAGKNFWVWQSAWKSHDSRGSVLSFQLYTRQLHNVV